MTIVEITGLLLVIVVGLWAFTQGGDNLDFSRIILFENEGERSTFVAVTAATSLAFFAMVGFEDSVNMAEETKDPVRIFPKVLLSGLTIAGIVYVLVSIIAVALVPIGELDGEQDTAGRCGRGRGAGACRSARCSRSSPCSRCRIRR